MVALYFLLGEFVYIKYQQMAGINPDVLEYRGENGFLAREYLTEEASAAPATTPSAASVTGSSARPVATPTATSSETSSTVSTVKNLPTLKGAVNGSMEVIPKGIRLVQVEETQSQVEIALKYDFFHYDKPQKADYLFVYSQVLPAVVHLYDEDLKTNGSGFIMEITKDSIYVVTNFHVAQYMINDCRVYFSQNIWADAEFLGSDDFFDLAA
jgi:S1-C subfamily serine protease